MYINELFKDLDNRNTLDRKVFIRNGMYLFDFEVAIDAETGHVVLDLIDPEEESTIITQDDQGLLVVQPAG